MYRPSCRGGGVPSAMSSKPPPPYRHVHPSDGIVKSIVGSEKVQRYSPGSSGPSHGKSGQSLRIRTSGGVVLLSLSTGGSSSDVHATETNSAIAREACITCFIGSSSCRLRRWSDDLP